MDIEEHKAQKVQESQLKSYTLGILIKNPQYLKLAIEASNETMGVVLAIP